MRIVFCILLALCGALLMYLESQQQPAPGVMFAIGFSLLLAAAYLVSKDDEL
jgi:drug/metabolite transporter (DMT)-like permease